MPSIPSPSPKSKPKSRKSMPRKTARTPPRYYGAESVGPHRVAMAERAAQKRLKFPKYPTLNGLTRIETRQLKKSHLNNQLKVVGNRQKLVKKYMTLSNKAASAGKRKTATRKVYDKHKIPDDLQRKINRLINKSIR